MASSFLMFYLSDQSHAVAHPGALYLYRSFITTQSKLNIAAKQIFMAQRNGGPAKIPMLNQRIWLHMKGK